MDQLSGASAPDKGKGSEQPTQAPTSFALVLEATRPDSAARDLRRLLKIALRRFGLRCTELRSP